MSGEHEGTVYKVEYQNPFASNTSRMIFTTFVVGFNLLPFSYRFIYF